LFTSHITRLGLAIVPLCRSTCAPTRQRRVGAHICHGTTAQWPVQVDEHRRPLRICDAFKMAPLNCCWWHSP